MQLIRLFCSAWVFVGCFSVAVIAQDEQGTLYYDAASGEIFLDIQTHAGRILGFDLRSDQGLIMTDNYLRMGEPTTIFFLSDTYLTDSAGPETDRPDGLYGIGPIFPPNMSEADFLADVVSTNWGRPGTAALMPFEIAFGRPTGIPLNDPDLPKLQDSWAETVQLRYNAPTGELILDTTGDQGGLISHLVLWGDEFQVENAISPGFDLWDITDGLIGGLGIIDEGVYNLGALLEPGLSPEELSSALSRSGWKGPAGVGVSGFDIQSADGTVAFALVHVPEPSSASLGLIAVGLLATGRRRRRPGSPS